MRGEPVGQVIRRLRQGRRWSQARLARETSRIAGVAPDALTRQDIYRYEKGKRTPTAWLPHIATALGVPVEDLEHFVRAKASSVPGLDDLLPEKFPLSPLATRGGRRVGRSTVRDLSARVHGLRLADDVIAGGDLIEPAYRELRAAVRVFQESTYTEDIGRALLVAIGELAQIVGWIASDAGHHQEAERVYQLGISAAQDAGDLTLVGNLAGSLAYQYSNTGLERRGAELAIAALAAAGPDAPARARALYLDRVAWAETKRGKAQEAIKALGRASEALASHAGEDEPAYLYWVDAGELQVMEARCFTELRRPLRAVPVLTDVLGRYDNTHTRELALYLSWLAIAYADANEPEQSGHTAGHMLDLATDLPSDRIADRSRRVLTRLEQFRDVAEVRNVLDRYAS